MIKVNLLSPSDRLSVKWEKVNHLVVANIAKVVIIQLIFVFFLFVSIKYLDSKVQNLNRQLEGMQLETEAKEIKEIKSNMKSYENQLKQMTYIQKSQKEWTRILDDFGKIVPQGVKITNFSVQQCVAGGLITKKGSAGGKLDCGGEYEANITGNARKRDNLLVFENNLKNSELFSDLVTSESNYIKKEDVDFKYSAIIKKEDLTLSK